MLTVAPPRWVRAAFWTVVAVEWAVVAGLTVILLIPVWHRPTREAVIEMLCLGPDTTRYAAGYSQAAWDDIRRGDHHTKVLATLGEPLERWSHADDEWWSYSTQATGTDNYLERKVRFDLRRHVIETHEACYID